MEIKKIIGWSFLMFLCSCEKNITVKAPSQEEKIVVHSITGINTPFTAMVGKTRGILERITPDSFHLSNAVLLLYQDNVLMDTLTYNAGSGNYITQRNTIAKAGFRYQLKATAPGFTTAESETAMTQGISIESISRKLNVRADADSNIYDELKIRFRDDLSTSNYYIIKFRRPFNNRREIHYEELYCMRSVDTDIDRRTDIDQVLFDDCIDREFILPDKNFNGRTKEFIVFIRRHELEPVFSAADNRQYRTVVELNNITAEHYKYLKSYSGYRESEDNPFAEPVLVFSNIRNGYGLFSTYNLAVDTIR